MQSDWLLKQQRFERTKMNGKNWKIFNFQAEKFRPPNGKRAKVELQNEIQLLTHFEFT